VTSLPPMRRKRVTIAAQEIVGSDFLDDTKLPLRLTPNADVDLVAWAQANVDHLEAELRRYGAILFRGFGVGSTGELERFAGVFTDELLNYIEGSSPRVMLADKVYTSTEYPPEYPISLHNELSYAHKWPAKLFFYCEQPPESGGETPIADGRRILELLPPDLIDRFERKGVRYIRKMHGGDGAGLSWKTVFETDDREFVESYCREGEITYRWTEDGGLWTSQDRPGVIRHPKTGERVWFNQADQWHPSNLGEELARAMYAVADRESLPLNVEHADGTPIALEDLETVRATFRDAAVRFPWEKGDVLLVDNTMVSHGRMPFTGRRRVVVSMGETVHLRDGSGKA
jgi:alpha-ketoglutarate-dependent taurine dioxygenase